MAISEKIELLGKGLYGNIPDVLTLSSIPTASELDYVGSEEFDKTMIEKILPAAVEEKIDFYKLLEIDYYWICRCLRILNYGPYFTTNAIICGDCGKITYGEYSVDVRTVDVKPLPDGFKNDIVISRDEFIDFNQDVHLKLTTIADRLNMDKDKMFQDSKGKTNTDLARICYSITSIGVDNSMSPIDVKHRVTHDFSPADYLILQKSVLDLTDYGLRSGGHCGCPACSSKEATFLALVDDRFFRPTLGDLREWKRHRDSRGEKDVRGSKTDHV